MLRLQCGRLLRAQSYVRRMSVLSAFPHDVSDGDITEFPRVMRGLNYDLNWSLAGDKITTRGEAYRNASVRDLIEFSSRKDVRVTKARAVVGVNSVVNVASGAPLFATDSFTGASAVDVEDFEKRLISLQSDCLSYAPRLFVHDGALAGASRDSELRVRVITDSPLVALSARSLLHRTPLYAPEVFPRTLTVYAATLASSAIEAGASLPRGASVGEGGASPPHIMIDVDPSNARGSVASVGHVSFASLYNAIALASGALQLAGGYRHIPGGHSNPNIREARADGLLGLYLQDGHIYAPASEAHPDILTLQGDVIMGAATATAAAAPTLVVGDRTGAVASAFADKGRLSSAHHAVWHATKGITGLWAGALLTPKSKLASSPEALPRGAVSAYGCASVPLPFSAQKAHPARIVFVGGTKEGDIATQAPTLAAVHGKKGAEKLAARLAAHSPKIVHVATPAEAIELINSS